MEKIKLYFAGHCDTDAESDLGVKNRLFSFVYPTHFKKWIELTKQRPGSIILDSGAFSAWNKGVSIDFNAYITYIHNIIDICNTNNKELHIVNLDVIPGKVGITKNLSNFLNSKNKDIIDKAAKKGLQNLKHLKKEGVKNPIHVFHQGEDWEWLDKMIKYTNYIGISPANDMSSISKHKWIESVFDYLYNNSINVKTHGFAVMNTKVLRQFPWTSCDSTTWLQASIKGELVYPIKGYTRQNNDYTSPFYMRIHINSLKNSIILKNLERQGYSFSQLSEHKVREKININTFLMLEEWLNIYKENKKYTPYKKLFTL